MYPNDDQGKGTDGGWKAEISRLPSSRPIQYVHQTTGRKGQSFDLTRSSHRSLCQTEIRCLCDSVIGRTGASRSLAGGGIGVLNRDAGHSGAAPSARCISHNIWGTGIAAEGRRLPCYSQIRPLLQGARVHTMRPCYLWVARYTELSASSLLQAYCTHKGKYKCIPHPF